MVCVSLFALFGVLTLLFSIIQLMGRASTEAFIVYPLYKETGDPYIKLRTLSRMQLPILVIQQDGAKHIGLQQEFIYAHFIDQSNFTSYIEQNYGRKE